MSPPRSLCCCCRFLYPALGWSRSDQDGAGLQSQGGRKIIVSVDFLWLPARGKEQEKKLQELHNVRWEKRGKSCSRTSRGRWQALKEKVESGWWENQRCIISIPDWRYGGTKIIYVRYWNNTDYCTWPERHFLYELPCINCFRPIKMVWQNTLDWTFRRTQYCIIFFSILYI